MSSKQVEIENEKIYKKLSQMFAYNYTRQEQLEKVSVILNHFRHDVRAECNGTETIEELNREESVSKIDQTHEKDMIKNGEDIFDLERIIGCGAHPAVQREAFDKFIEKIYQRGHLDGRQELMCEDSYHPGQSPMVIFRDHIIDDTVPTQKDLTLDQRVAVLPFGDCDKVRFGHVAAIYSTRYGTTVCDVGIHMEGHDKKKFVTFDRIRRITPIASRQQLWLILLNDAIDSASKVELLKSLNKTGLLTIKLPADEEELERCRKEKRDS